jgi:hypothetical protein
MSKAAEEESKVILTITIEGFNLLYTQELIHLFIEGLKTTRNEDIKIIG